MPAVIDKGMNMFKKIMVPVDPAHRDATEPALTAAADLARHDGIATHTGVSVFLVRPPAGRG